MDTDYSLRSRRKGNKHPLSGAIYRWGNGENGCGGKWKLYKSASGECRLNNGPTGPVDKTGRWDSGAWCFPEKRGTALWRTRLCNRLYKRR